MQGTMQDTGQTAGATRSTWQIDGDHTRVGFSVRHMMITTVTGHFAGVRGELELDESDVTRSAVRVELDAASLDTQSAQRDEHLRSADFFAVAQHPLITFVSRTVSRAGADRLTVTGDLTIRGVTHEVVLEVEEQGRGRDPWGGERLGLVASTRIDRRDYGLTWNQALEAGGVLVADMVTISLDVQLVRAD
jgi:polyisoprenoid-binding protein YceI